MEGRKENKYNLSGICPGCGKLFRVELIIATELVETGKTTKKEEETDAKEGKPDGSGPSPVKSKAVRRARGKGKTDVAATGENTTTTTVVGQSEQAEEA